MSACQNFSDLFFSKDSFRGQKPASFNGKLDYYGCPSWDFTMEEDFEHETNFNCGRRGHADYQDIVEATDIIQLLGYYYAKESVLDVIANLIEDECGEEFEEDDIEELLCMSVDINMIRACAFEELVPLTIEQMEIVRAAPRTMGAVCCIHSFEDGIRQFMSDQDMRSADEWLEWFLEIEENVCHNDFDKEKIFQITGNYPGRVIGFPDFESLEEAHDNVITYKVNYHCSSPASIINKESTGMEDFMDSTIRPELQKISSDYDLNELLGIPSKKKTVIDYDDISLSQESLKWVEDMVGKARKAVAKYSSGSDDDLTEKKIIINANGDYRKQSFPIKPDRLQIHITQDDIINSEDSFMIYSEFLESVEMDGNAFIFNDKVYAIVKRESCVVVTEIIVSVHGFKKSKAAIIYANKESDLFSLNSATL